MWGICSTTVVVSVLFFAGREYRLEEGLRQADRDQKESSRMSQLSPVPTSLRKLEAVVYFQASQKLNLNLNAALQALGRAAWLIGNWSWIGEIRSVLKFLGPWTEVAQLPISSKPKSLTLGSPCCLRSPNALDSWSANTSKTASTTGWEQK